VLAELAMKGAPPTVTRRSDREPRRSGRDFMGGGSRDFMRGSARAGRWF